jgi:queuine tRNA-ribosyltransferase
LSSTTSFQFDVEVTAGAARAGVFTTPHGVVESPAFMPVGTLATVKAIDPAELRAMRAQMILSNAYHLHLRPGDELIRSLGGLHGFMGWDGPILTDSGGFQVFSLASLRSVSEDGVEFKSHLDGSRRHFTPELVMRIERNLGADVMMQFDHVIPGQSEEAVARDASERSIRWLERCRAEFDRLGREGDANGNPYGPQALFPVVQGGIHASLRRDAATRAASVGDWIGYGIGGLSVGEPKPEMYARLETMDGSLPRDRPGEADQEMASRVEARPDRTRQPRLARSGRGPGLSSSGSGTERTVDT